MVAERRAGPAKKGIVPVWLGLVACGVGIDGCDLRGVGPSGPSRRRRRARRGMNQLPRGLHPRSLRGMPFGRAWRSGPRERDGALRAVDRGTRAECRCSRFDSTSTSIQLKAAPSPAGPSNARSGGTQPNQNCSFPTVNVWGRAFTSASASGASCHRWMAGSDGACVASPGSSGRRAVSAIASSVGSKSPKGRPVRLSSAQRDRGG